MEIWILFTLLAVAMQSLRTAAQKQIAQSVSASSATLVRYLFGLPFALAYFFFLRSIYVDEQLVSNAVFFRAASLAAIAQIFATVFLIKALTLRNFAVGTALAKTEALLTAIIGALFFSAALSPIAYLSVAIGVAGVLVASNWKISVRDLFQNESIKFGIGAGLGFALASLWIREASLSLEINRIYSAAAVLLYMVVVQTVACLLYVLVREAGQLPLILARWRASIFIGFSSLAGSVGWFTAMSLQEAAIVKTLGQTEFVVTLLITYFYFGEKISAREYIGILLVALSVMLLITAA
ncbi:MAG: multidrug transporter [Pseudohongiella sp.]|nr:MAG: multidrug transporter [Pseudohongiella sp.]